MKKWRTYFVTGIVALSLYVGLFVTSIVLAANGSLSSNPYLAVGLMVGNAFLATFYAVTMVLFIAYLDISKNASLESEYNLGVALDVMNLYAFQRVLHRAIFSRFRRKREQYFVSFSASNSLTLQNAYRNKDVASLNANIAISLNDILQINKKRLFKKQKDTFCFADNSFVLYLFDRDLKQVQELCSLIQDRIYEIVNDNDIHLFVQPLFGIAEINPLEKPFVQIENAIIARQISEKNFESITVYDEEFRSAAAAHNDREEILEALHKREFVVYYQAKYSLTEKAFTSSEALVRWDSDKYGFLTPAQFVEKASESGLLHDINLYVFHQVCADLQESKRRGRRILPVSINFSLHEFFSSQTMEEIFKTMKEYDIDPSLIQIEIVETVSQANKFLSISIIKKLQERGIRILMDDFGVGFSNLGNLRTIPFNAIKFDKSLVDDIVTDEKAREYLRLLIALCKSLGMEVICEGVDSKEQIDYLRRFHCDVIQGYYYSKPVPKAEYDALLAENPFEKKGEAK